MFCFSDALNAVQVSLQICVSILIEREKIFSFERSFFHMALKTESERLFLCIADIVFQNFHLFVTTMYGKFKGWFEVSPPNALKVLEIIQITNDQMDPKNLSWAPFFMES